MQEKDKISHSIIPKKILYSTTHSCHYWQGLELHPKKKGDSGSTTLATRDKNDKNEFLRKDEGLKDTC